LVALLNWPRKYSTKGSKGSRMEGNAFYEELKFIWENEEIGKINDKIFSYLRRTSWQ
jgi:hypothetical protein